MKEQYLARFGLKRNKFIGLSLFFGFLFLASSVFGQAPTITSFSPRSGEVGATVTISGTGFDATATNNVVFVGGLKAAVTSASSTQISFTVPNGASSANIQYSNLTTNLSCVSPNRFVVKFSSNTPIEVNSYTDITTVGLGFNLQAGESFGLVDFNNDGKVDFIYNSISGSTKSLRLLTNNSSNSTNVTSASFSETTLSSWSANSYGSGPIALSDFNGDGLIDAFCGSVGYNGSKMLMQDPNNLGQFIQQTYNPSSYQSGVRPIDFTNDGKIDLISTYFHPSLNYYPQNNNSIPGTASIDFNSGSVSNLDGSAYSGTGISDLDKNGYSDILIVSNDNSRLNIRPNSSLGFGTTVQLSLLTSSKDIKLADLNGDGFDDIVAGGTSGRVSVYRNTSSIGNISFASRLDFTNGTNEVTAIDVVDFNGDGLPDIVAVQSNTIVLFLNTTSGGVLSFDSGRQLSSSGSNVRDVKIIDINNDGIPEIVTRQSNGMRIFSYVPQPSISVSSSINSFLQCGASPSPSQTIIVSGSNLATNISIGALTNYQYSLDDVTFSTSLTIPHVSGTVAPTTVYVRYNRSSTGTNGGNITLSSTGATSQSLAVTGSRAEAPSISGRQSVFIGQTVSLTGSGSPDANTPWVSSDPTVASVDNNGVVTGQSAGTVTITYNNNVGCSASITITSSVFVTPPTITSLSTLRGEIGSEVIISGSNFNSTASNNSVYFGGTKATITAATSTSLTVNVPNTDIYSKVFVVSNNVQSNAIDFHLTQNTSGNLSNVWSTSYFKSPSSRSIGFNPSQDGIYISDIDSDGDNDILVISSASSSIKLFLNNGTSNLTAYSTATLSTSGTPIDIETNDIDNDGDIDILVSTNNKKIDVFTNLNNTFSLATTITPTTTDSNLRLKVADMDLDGYSDIIVFAQSGTSDIQIISNYGNVSFGAPNTVYTGSLSSTRRIGVSDFNLDRYPEIVFNVTNSIYILQNVSGIISGTPVNVGTVSNSVSYGAIEFLDYDNDGDIDFTGSGQETKVFLNDGLGNFSSSFSAPGRAHSFFFDINADGFNDFIQKDLYYDIEIRKANGITTFANGGISMNTSDGTTSYLRIADFNGDNYPDLVYYTNGDLFIAEYEGNTSPTITVSGTLSNFDQCGSTPSESQSVVVSGINLNGNITLGTLTNYQYSLDDVTFNPSLTIPRVSGSVSPTTVYIRYNRSSTGTNGGNITLSSIGATSQIIAVSGTRTNGPIISAQPATIVEVCQNSNYTLAATVSGATSYQWYSNTSNSTTGGTSLGAANNAQTVALTPDTSTAGTFYYYLVATSGSCSTTSNVSVVTVSAPPVAGTATASNSSLCAGETSTLSLTGHTGTIQWQSSTDNSTWTNVSSGGTSASFTTPALSATTYYRAQLSSGSCAPVTSNVLTLSVAPGLAQFGNALNFDGSNDHAVLPNLTSGLSSFTFEAWVNPSTLSDWQRVFDFGTNTSNYMFLTTQSGGVQKPRFGIKSTATNEVVVNSSVAINTSEWSHLALTLDAVADEAKIYVNGVLTGTASIAISPADLGNLSAHYLGRSLFSNDPYFNGSLDEVRLWNSVRTASEILAGKDSELTGSETGLVAYYNFNQGTPSGSNTGITALTNLTSNANLNGILTNFSKTGSTSNFVENSNSPSISGVGGGVCIGSSSPFTFPISGGTWSSSNTGVFTVSSTGEVTGVAAGTATLSYTFVRNNCSLTATRVVTILPAVAAPVVGATSNTRSFTNVGTTTWVVPTGVTSVEYLVVGGGGGGGNGFDTGGGGGGGGGMVLGGTISVSPGQSIDVTVGTGGTGGDNIRSNRNGTSGSNSSFGNIIALGGGFGNGSRTGGTGLGGTIQSSTTDAPTGGIGGGNASNSIRGSGGGGGGAGGNGGNGSSSSGGVGGSGILSSITGAAISYGIGGAGARGNVNTAGMSGTSNRGVGGSGGGATSNSSRGGGNGGSGVVILKYQTSTGSSLDYCVGETATALTATATSGNTLNWYTVATGGTASATAPVPSTSAAGTTMYYVSQVNANGCESERVAITVNVLAIPSAPTVSNVNYCLGATATALTATATSGNTLNWYTVATGGTASATAPVPSTSAIGITTYYVSQVNANGCESPRTAITATVAPIPSAPTVSNVTYCLGETASALTATAGTGNTLNWYTLATGGTASSTAPVPTTSALGTTTYYVSQVNTTGCESERAAITVTVSALPDFVYGSSSYSFERTRAISTAIPTSTGATITSYAINPALPAGLTFNTSTGAISGTPSAVSTSQSYTVTGTTSSGCTSTASITVEVFNAVAPSALSYSPATQTVRQGTAITAMTPTISGGTPSYTISPALPAGLSINATTGVISGTLNAAQTGTVTYTITATNSGGSTTATVSLVFNTAPTAIALAPAAVAENAASGTTVGTLSATDADTGDTFTFALVSGTGATDNASFTIDGTSLKTAAVFDFETKNSYSVRVRVTDAGGLTFERQLTIMVTDVNEDRDGDGVRDNEEAADGTDPLDACSFNIASQNATPSDAWKLADCDNDGLTNQEEKELNSSPTDSDTDGDGVPDGVEVEEGTNPTNNSSVKDTDGDGIPNYVETQEGTNPNDSNDAKDTDGDGVPDYVEVQQGTDPNDADVARDSDGDGVPDYVETVLWPNQGLPAGNPNVAGEEDRDTDGDGVPDYQEVLDGTNPKNDTDSKDTDGDGVPDYVEVQQGTNPSNANDAKDTDGDGVPDYVETVLWPNQGLPAGNPNVAGEEDRDTDGDGVPDYQEVIDGTDPKNDTDAKDSDGDGVPDSVEVQQGTNPNNADDAKDSDGDGVPDYVETVLWPNQGLPAGNPNNPADGTRDTDGDGVPDYQEVVDGTDPTKASDSKDSDGDGVPDFVEVQQGTNPNNADDVKDTDGDGVPDYVETVLWPSLGLPAGNPNTSGDQDRDTDGDGVPDYQEIRDGSDATDATDAKDTDGDGVPDFVETQQGTNPNNASDAKDTDGDGVPDYVETVLWPNQGIPAGNPNAGGDQERDTDGDGVPDYQEVIDGTNPNDGTDTKDTDGDGVPDHVELAAGTDPSNPDDATDTDGDGVPDYVETVLWPNQGLPAGNPNAGGDQERDTDGDGVPDFVEVQQGTDPTDATDSKDSDGDGVPDHIEVAQGTDPNDPADGTDTDGDGVPDYVETVLWPNQGLPAGDPTAAGDEDRDTDGDGVPDYIEVLQGTNPGNATDVKDSDGDGVPDYLETVNVTDINDPKDFKDSDGDGVPDFVETQQGTSPSNASDFKDTDGDGIPDYVENVQGTDPADPSDFKDTDGDGVPDYVEVQQGTNPSNAADAKDSDGDGVPDHIQFRSIQLSVLEEVVVLWGDTDYLNALPKQLEVALFSGDQANLDVVWTAAEKVNIIKRGTYELKGTLVLPKGVYNPYQVNGVVRVTVLPKPAPLDVTITNNTFAGSTEEYFIPVGAFIINDPVDNIHVVSLYGDGYDNSYFEIKDNILFWSSADRAEGKTMFSIVVRVTDRDGNTIEKFFTINRTRSDFASLVITNAFSPNGDGANDTWGVNGLRFYQGVRISVYDRGGSRLFYTENPDVRWDGTYNGKEMPAASYFWTIEIGETGETRRGMLNLIRK